MSIPKHILLEINDELKKSSNKEHLHQVKESTSLQSKYDAVQARIKRARDLLLDMNISKEEYDEIISDSTN